MNEASRPAAPPHAATSPGPRALRKPYNIARLRLMAARRLPAPIFHYLDGGSDDERSLARNTAAFGDYEFLPQVLADVSQIRTQTRLFGRPAAWPLMLGPTGLTQMFHDKGERAVARAAARAGLPYALSTLGTTTIEHFAAASEGPKAFQIYIFKDRGLTTEFIERCRAAKIDALILTVDTPVAGNRERDRASGLNVPPRLTLKSALSFAAHPRWALSALNGRKFEFANLVHRAPSVPGGGSLFDYVNAQFDPSLKWADLEWLAAQWGGPLLVKGVLTPQDAGRAAACGATGVALSNHGGRQLDGAAPPVDQIAEVREAVGPDFEIICDGGVRRGSDVVKALALGANACSVGRAYLYGLAAGGEQGVDLALRLLADEFARTLALLGVNDIADLGRQHLRKIGAAASCDRGTATG